MTDEREAMGPHEAREQPTFTSDGSWPDARTGPARVDTSKGPRYTGVEPAPTSARDDSLDALARDLENAGHPKWAARLSLLARDLDPYLLPQMPVTPPVPEPEGMPSLELVELTERVDGAEAEK